MNPLALPETKPSGKPARLGVHFSSESAEHYTPPAILAAVVRCLGGIDLDPCSNPGRTTPAWQHYTATDNGLLQPWHGRVFMNPPYGRQIKAWAAKLCQEYHAGRVATAVALIPARTDTAWFNLFSGFPVCFVRGRLTFIGNRDPAPFPSALVYLGGDIAGFHAAFRDIGAIRPPCLPDGSATGQRSEALIRNPKNARRSRG